MNIEEQPRDQDGSEFNHLPLADRSQRQLEAIRRESDSARELGHIFDGRSDEFEGAVAWAEEMSESLRTIDHGLVRDVRSLFDARGDIKDPGSVDEDLIQELGYDVCTSPDLLAIIIDQAKISYADQDGLIKVEDVLRGKDLVENQQEDYARAMKAGFVLIDHGVSEDEVRSLIETEPKTLRSVARILEEPILGPFSEMVTRTVAQHNARYSFTEITVHTLLLMRAYNQHQAALEAGDVEAIKLQQELIRMPMMQHALGEMLLREEHEVDGVPKDLPDPQVP